MEGIEDISIFSTVVTADELETIPKDVYKKIETFTSEKFDELFRYKALLATTKSNTDKELSELHEKCNALQNDRDNFVGQLNISSQTIAELENQLSKSVAEVAKLQRACNKLEIEATEFRHQRNIAIDEKDEVTKMIERRNSEVSRLKAEFDNLSKQLESAVTAKCEALAQIDEVQSMKISIEYREKQIVQERNLYNEQIKMLTEDLQNRTEELLNMRRDNTSRCIQLETKLNERTQELALATDQIKMLTDLNNNLTNKAQELTQKLQTEKETFLNTQEAMEKEMEAQAKLSELYKQMSDEKMQHAETLAKAVTELKTKLNEAVEKYGDLESKAKEQELVHEEIIEKKNECIQVLKKELETLNEFVNNLKSDNMERDIEGISPTAAAASKLIKCGMSLTQIYAQYVTVADELASEKEENQKLKSYINQIVQELQDKSPLLIKQREELEKALETIAELTKTNDDLINENQDITEQHNTCKRYDAIKNKEILKLKSENNDLSRQVCRLLQEIEIYKTGSSTTSSDQDIGDSISSADIISKRLVTFGDICELQSLNQRLLATIRELSSKQEEAESLDPAAIATLSDKLNAMREEHGELLEQQERQSKMINQIIAQRDMYKTLYAQAMKASGEDPIFERSYSREMTSDSPKPGDVSELPEDDKVNSLQLELEKAKKDIERIKEDSDAYRNEKLANEKILLEQIEKMRNEIQELTKQNTKLSAKCESNDELFKISKNNLGIYKQQIEKLEERNKIYSDSIVKHETSISYLKDQILEAQTKLSRAEVQLAGSQKEIALLRDSESRLLKERVSLKNEVHSSTILHKNIELIKCTLERTDAESKMRIEEQLKEAHRECAALRRRLQEEQDRFRQLTSHLEKQSQNAQARMEEEKQQADKLRIEVTELREDLVVKSQQIEDLSKKLKTAMLVGADNSSDSQRFKEMEKLLTDSQAEVDALQQKLKNAKEASDQYCNIAEGAEKRVTDMLQQQKEYEEKMTAQIQEQQEKILKLEEQCSELQGELSVMNDGQDANYSTNAQLKIQDMNAALTMELANAKTELDLARKEIKTLSENLEVAENKYAREMMLHSNDLQSLTSIKEELTKVLTEINNVKNERDCAKQALDESKIAWKKEEELFFKEKRELEERFKNLESQNALLLDQLQSLNTHMSVMQTQISDSQNTSIGDTSLNKSLTEDDIKSSDQLLKIIKYLRQEKDIAVNKCEILEAEHLRLKSSQDLLKSQLDELKATLENERQKSEMSIVASAKHSEVLRKVETLNAITDSNRCLRTERDELIAEVNKLKQHINNLEEQIAPLQEGNHELTKKAEAMQTENITLREEGKRWRQRANMLIEKSNRTSPEDWKKLQNERENLAKQLTIERSNVVKLTDELNVTKEIRSRLDEQLRQVKQAQISQKDELNHLTEELGALRGQMTLLNQDLAQSKEFQERLTSENDSLKEEVANRKNNLSQIRKIARKYKTQCEDQIKEIEALKQQIETKTNEPLTDEGKEQLRQEGRSELEQRINDIEQTHTERINQLSQQVTTATEETENYKREIEALKQSTCDKEDRFKALFKNAKDRIKSLTDENNMLKLQVNKQQSTSQSPENQEEGGGESNQLESEIERLQKEKQEILLEKQQDKERYTAEIETLTQKVAQQQRQLGLQQGSKPSTSSGPTEKPAIDPPTANIKPMAGHSTNTQTQSVQILPWRSNAEPPLASIRPMSVQVRTVAVPPTSQSPSAVVPPQQQVHTTGSGNSAEAISSSPSSSHTDYAPATSSASSATHGVKQASVPPTQSTQDTEDEDTTMQIQTTAQQQAVALVLPRIEPPSSGSSQEQGTSNNSGSSNTVTTTQAGLKRPREADTESNQVEDPGKTQQQQKRSRLQHGSTEAFQSVSESGLEVEYQVPTSSQRDHEEETDAVIVVESDEEGEPDEGEGADDEPDDPDTEGYDMESMPYQEQEIHYDDADCADEEDEGDNEVEVIEDSSEVPNQSERSEQEGVLQEENSEQQAQSEAISSGTDGASGVTVSQASTSQSSTMTSFSRARPIPPLSRPQQAHLLLPHGLDEGGDDGIVPSTPTLFVPRRSDGFGEAVSSPHVPICGRFTFNESVPPSNNIGSTEIIPEQTLEVANLDDNSTGRSVPSTPLQASPQEAGPSTEEQNPPTEVEIPMIMVTGEDSGEVPEGSSGTCMGPPSIAGTSTDNQQTEQPEETAEGEDEVSSEGEKAPAAEEGVEEGREAEASPSTNTKSKSAVREQSHSTRRSVRQSVRTGARNAPTPIVWSPEQQQQQQQQQQQLQTPQPPQQQQRAVRQETPHRGRGTATPGAFGPRGGRRARTRSQRPYSRY